MPISTASLARDARLARLRRAAVCLGVAVSFVLLGCGTWFPVKRIDMEFKSGPCADAGDAGLCSDSGADAP